MRKGVCFFLFLLIVGITPLAYGENLANDKLLEFLQENGFLTKDLKNYLDRGKNNVYSNNTLIGVY
jgi:hypothetical protein